MKKITIVILFSMFITIYNSQNLLGDKYLNIKLGALKYNEKVFILTHYDTPICLIVSRTSETKEYLKTFLFIDDICISETYFYPEENFEQRFNLLSIQYGEAKLESNIYYWISGELKITLTTTFNKMVGKIICQINYCYLSNIKNIIDITNKLQSPYIELKKLKSE